jgi:hypothetical protein
MPLLHILTRHILATYLGAAVRIDKENQQDSAAMSLPMRPKEIFTDG